MSRKTNRCTINNVRKKRSWGNSRGEGKGERKGRAFVMYVRIRSRVGGWYVVVRQLDWQQQQETKKIFFWWVKFQIINHRGGEDIGTRETRCARFVCFLFLVFSRFGLSVSLSISLSLLLYLSIYRTLSFALSHI